jgi:hypothetical protein
MKSWGKAIGYGVLVWLVPFVVAFLIFPIHEQMRPLFESIMAVVVAAAVVIFGLAYLKRVDANLRREGMLLGLLWFVICVVIDAPLMLLGGPMKMSLGNYLADIGVTYLMIIAITTGLAVARSGNLHP